MSTYSESAKGITITYLRAIQEVLRHSCRTSDFFADCGVHETYLASDVLSWLGY